MNNRDRRAVILGGSALAMIAAIWLIVLPVCSTWADTRDRADQSRKSLDNIAEQTRRLIAMDRQLEPSLGAAVKKPLVGLSAARTQLVKNLIDLHNNCGAQISSMQPEAPRTIQEVPGVVRLTVQVQSMCQPSQLVQLLAGARNNPDLLLLDRIETTGGMGQMNVTMVWSTLAKSEAAR
jgi:hypothetical protein